MKNFDIVVYHDPCSDGMASAWSALKYNPNMHKMPCKAGEINTLDFTMFREKRVLFTDICPLYDEIVAISKIAKWITILDHHKTVFDMYKEKYRENIESTIVTIHNNVEFDLDLGRAGCQITWDYFFPHISPTKNRPWFINYIADRDLWHWKMDFSKEINSALYSLNYIKIDKMDILENMTCTEIDNLKKVGSDTLLSSNGEIDKICKKGEQCITTINNVSYNIWLISCNYTYRSEVGNKLSKTPFPNGEMPDFTAIWTKDPNSSDLWISLRNINDIDLNKLCKQYDSRGGGHFHAAGFTIRGQKLEDVFKVIK
jgi:oligoribonuclease NrnB/cAMP/cGMP phosphodiesterase (DHH superfamily)